MGTENYNHEIGYETLLADFKRYQSQTPKGISLQNKRNRTIILKFKINGSDKSKGCNCAFTLEGMSSALIKARLVADRLKTATSIVEFEAWYDEVILEKNKIVDDRLTFKEAIAIVEGDYWNRYDRRNRKRDKTNASNIDAWYRTYGCYYKYLPSHKTVNIDSVLAVLDRWNVGTRSYKYALSAFKKLARMSKRNDILDALEAKPTNQTSFMKLQNLTLEDFLAWRVRTLTELPSNAKIEVRRAWLWVFSMQIVYGLRIHEVFAIANLDKPFVTVDGVTITALSDLRNNTHIIVVKDTTNLNTTTKTGYRLARPLIPPKYPNLIELLDIQCPLLPANRPRSTDAGTIRRFYATTARQKLIMWNSPISQTHALRHLANINGIQAGIPIEVRAISLGHSPTMNESTYKKRCATQTMLDLLES
jgi:hypothetical protein